MSNQNIKTVAIEKYNETIDKFGVDSKDAVHWHNQQTQYYRFEMIKRYIPNDSDISILDIGCGNAEFFKYLNFTGFRGKYVGYDINENFIHASREIYKDNNAEFKVVDILEDNIMDKFDYVILSGLFNNNYGQNDAWIKKMIDKMYQLANKKVIFNAISTYTNFKDKEMYYINPLDISDYIIRNLSAEIILEHGRLPYNFQIVINKDNSWVSI